MRKTSQDRTDSTSLTSGLDNDLKKPGTSTNKIKKSSIKRKVQNFSHDSDDAIIEPLLQTEKENPVNANRSAKYLMNKSKTECLYEEDTKTFENPTVALPVSIANVTTNVTTNIITENQTPPSITSETAPIYRHMNINVFTGHEGGFTNNSIFVEITGCKDAQVIAPLIFTTAKIHSDSKKKLMEHLHATPMPIVSTIESNVKAEPYEDDKRHNILHTNKYDASRNLGNISDFKLESANFNDSSHVKVLTTETLSKSPQVKNEQNLTKELDDRDPFEISAKLFCKDQKISLKTSIDNSIDTKLPKAKVTSDDKVASTSKPITAAASCKSNGGYISETSKQLIANEPKSITLDNNNIIEKSKGLSNNEKIILNKISQPSPSSSKQNNKSNINTMQSDKIDSIKNFSTGSKKLQRQKNAAIEEVKEINYKELNNFTIGQNSPVLDKALSTPPDLKPDNATICKPSTPMTTITTKGSTSSVLSGLPSKPLISSATNSSTSKPVIANTLASINSNPVTETGKTKPAPTRIPEPSRNVIPTTSSKTSISSTAKSIKVTDDRSSAKQDFKSVSVLPIKTNKTDSTTTTSSTASNLPLYIVSTSKTKIGSSSTPTVSTVTKKTLDQKPTSEVAKTNGKSSKLLMSPSSSETKQSSSKPKTTNVNVVKKDDRA